MIRTGIDITDTMQTTVVDNSIQLLERNGDAITLYGSPEALKELALNILEHFNGYGKEVARIEAQEVLNDELEQAVGMTSAPALLAG